MALKFQYNKIALQQLTKGLKIRIAALPTLRAKEAALRMEVKRLQVLTEKAHVEKNKRITEAKALVVLWAEFNTDLIVIDRIERTSGKLAGVAFREFKEMVFKPLPQSLLNEPAWTAEGVGILQGVLEARVRAEMLEKQTDLMEYERKRTTQKLNLFEKVQIPEYEDGIRRIKRYLEDEQNLAMAGMKMLKKKKEMQVS